MAHREWATARLERRHYHADHFCYSWHMDLDCKMAAYGIYLGFVIDGDSRMVLHAAVLPDKTACRVYEELFRPAVAAWGFPDQLNTDQGEEWRLCVFVCFFVWWAAGRASPAGRLPHKIVPSTSNVCCRRLVQLAAAPRGLPYTRDTISTGCTDTERALQLRTEHARIHVGSRLSQRAGGSWRA